MKSHLAIISSLLIIPSTLLAEPTLKEELEKKEAAKTKESPEQITRKHSDGSTKAATDQDELSADVQDLIQEQTDGKVIELLEKAEELMASATDNLDAHNTGGETIAIETEIIERIYEAAKQKQQSQSSNGQPQDPSGMMEMMEQMMGKSPGDKPGEQPGNQGGEGKTGDSDSANNNSTDGDNDGNSTTRRIPKTSGSAGSALPRELQKALEAFNKANADKR